MCNPSLLAGCLVDVDVLDIILLVLSITERFVFPNYLNTSV